ncbi:uncharacterized protein Z519_02703 [Cladophialophora bantiana CBS 173.52]|uniref:Uncharacterized protein n=1 Tax=Cladophialophora bantiana (strain ATCC 10958 / CBS 173.52 / CDC B-1940 / NIH 8579) TaxID=1442370 RepID=A0A0D2F4X3_CLAB1|nr:uncharacterized protein Z519_02703 [Cladophialophora bantiana CBS 173.52]KIW97311.1 hypothetical protein Z519_02703 [Cladophialophora bantiana CBS 173.52]
MELPQQVDAVKADYDKLCTFVKEKRLYWAFRLFYRIQLVSLPSWCLRVTQSIAIRRAKALPRRSTTLIDKYQIPTEPNLVEHVQNARVWLEEEKIRKQYLSMLSASYSPFRAGATRENAVVLVRRRVLRQQVIVPDFATFKTLSRIGFMACMSKIARVALPLLPVPAGLVSVSTFAIIKIAVGFTRFFVFWENIAGFWDGLKVLLWFKKTLEGFSVYNAGEFLSVIAGVFITVVSLVLIAIELSKATDPLEIAYNSLWWQQQQQQQQYRP